MVLRNNTTAALEVYDIANGQLTGAVGLAGVPSSFQVDGFAADSAPQSANASLAQLGQAMASFSPPAGFSMPSAGSLAQPDMPASFLAPASQQQTY